jgi:hypothetical protein
MCVALEVSGRRIVQQHGSDTIKINCTYGHFLQGLTARDMSILCDLGFLGCPMAMAP